MKVYYLPQLLVWVSNKQHCVSLNPISFLSLFLLELLEAFDKTEFLETVPSLGIEYIIPPDWETMV